MSACCWTARYEAAGQETQTDAMLVYLEEHTSEEADAMAAEAGYDVSPERAERDGGAYWLWEVWGDTCLLDAGHAGPHAFTRAKDLPRDLPPQPAPGAGA